MNNPEQPKHYISSSLGEVLHDIYRESIKLRDEYTIVQGNTSENFAHAEALLNGRLKEAMQYVKDIDADFCSMHKTERKVYEDALQSLETAIWEMQVVRTKVTCAADALRNAMYSCEIASVLGNNIKR